LIPTLGNAMNNHPRNSSTTKNLNAIGLALAIVFGLPIVGFTSSHSVFDFISSAHAEEDGSGGKKGGKDVKGGQGEDKGKGGEKGQKDSLTKGPTNSSGDYTDSGQGPRSKSSDTTTRGTRPVWAKEGITVELGRLNVTRAPQSVRDRQLAEALKTATTKPEVMAVYAWSIEQFAANLTDATARVDAPLANLAMYQAFIKELAKNPSATSITLTSLDKETKIPVTLTFSLSGNATPTSVLGIMLGSAADKDATKIGGLSAEVVSSVNLILGVTTDFAKAGLTTSLVGTAAETVRSTISTVHGE
jgi:hypothetical protein